MGMLTSAGLAIATAAQPSVAFAANAVTNVPKWARSTAYARGAQVISPKNDVVAAKIAHTSSASYDTDTARWTLSSTFARADQVVKTADLDFTPPSAGDVGAYSKPETDALVDASLQTYQGISMFDVGNFETLPRAPGFVDKALGSGTLWIQHFYPPRSTNPITSLGYPVRATAPSDVTLARMCLFAVASDGALTKVAQTATFTPAGTYTDQVQNLNTIGGFPSTYVLNRGARYAMGLLVVATNAGTCHGWDIPGSGNKPVISRRVAGQTDIATTYTNAAQSDWYEGLYLFGRHATG